MTAFLGPLVLPFPFKTCSVPNPLETVLDFGDSNRIETLGNSYQASGEQDIEKQKDT